jgi:hypothetical protein
MKNTKRSHAKSWWLAISATVITILLAGCATAPEHSFNDDFGENLTTQPKYSIQNEDAGRFTITVHQGTPSTGAERLLDVKQAATAIAAAEARRRGWERWQLNYIQEQNQGWMHIVIGEVTRVKYVKPTFPGAASSP